MNTIQLETVPPGDFETISAFTPDWKQRFLQLVEQKQNIKYTLHEMPNIPKDIQDKLGRNNYCDCFLKAAVTVAIWQAIHSNTCSNTKPQNRQFSTLDLARQRPRA